MHRDVSSDPSPRRGTAPRYSQIASVLATLCIAFLPVAAEAGEPFPPDFSKVFVPDTIGPGSVSMLVFTIDNMSTFAAENLAFTDTLPVGVTIADPASASTDCIDAMIDAPVGGSTITFTDGRVAGSSVCTARVNVTSSTVGMHTNVSGDLTSDSGNSGTATDDLMVVTDRPGFSKSFAPSTISLGGRSTLTFTIDNSANASALSSLVFTDNLPVGMVIADPTNLVSTCGGPNPMLTAETGTDVVSFSSFGILFPGFEVLLAGETCTIAVDVTATAGGMLENVSSDLTSNAGSSGKASDTLEVLVSEVALTKQFTDDPVPPGGTVTLEFTIQSFNRTDTATSIGFSDSLETTLSGLAPSGALPTDPCGAGSTLTFAAGTLTLAGGSLPPEGSCAFSVDLAVPTGAAPGVYPNTTSPIAFDFGVLEFGNPATDDLFVSAAPVITKEFLTDPVNPGDPVTVRFTITNTSLVASATDVAFEDRFATVLPTASVTPGGGCCGAGSTCTFAPLFNPPPPSDVTPATFTLSGGMLAPAGMADDSCTFDLTLDLSPTAPAGIVDNVTSPVTAMVDGMLATGEPATDSFTVIAAPTLSKVFLDDPVAPGGTVTLEFTLTNSANATGPATGITFTDDLAPVLSGLTANLPPSPDPPCGAGSTFTGSAGDTLLTLMGGTLNPGESCTWSVTLDVPAGAAPGTYTNTTSGVAAMVDGAAATSAAASDDLDVAGLMVTKEFIGDPVIPGQMVTLRFTLENISPFDDATAISFSDDLSLVLPGAPDLVVTTMLPLAACGGTLSEIGSGFLFFTGGVANQGDPPCDIDVALMVPAGVADGSYSNATGSPTALIDGSLVVLPPATDFLDVSSSLLAITKTFTDDPVAPGDSVTLDFTLTNLDPANTASAIAFTDDLDAALTGLTFDSVLFDDCGGAVVGTGTTLVDVSGVSLAADASCTISVSLTVPAGATANFYNNTTSDITGTISGFSVSGPGATDVLEVIDLLVFTKSFDGPTTATGTAVLTFTITNPGDSAATGIAFTDDLDAVISGLVATNLPLNDVCGAGSIVDGTSFLTFAGGQLPPMGGTCSFDVDVSVPGTAMAGTFPNATSDLTQFGIRVADPATANLVIEPAPLFAKDFAPNGIGLGQVSNVTLAIDNTASALAAMALDVTDTLPAGMVVATPPNAVTTCTGGTLTAVAGSSTVSYTGGEVAAGGVCSVSFDVTATAVGALVNTTGDLTSTSGNSGTAMDTLVVVPQPGFAKAFAPNPIVVGATSTLTLTIDNSASTVAATLLDVTDTLPAGMEVAAMPNAATTCIGGTLTAAAGSTTISYTGGTVAAGATCTIMVDVTGTAVGDLVNVTGPLTSSLGSSGTAMATLRVDPPPSFAKAFAPNPIALGATSTLTFTIDNSASTQAAMGLDFTDNLPAGVEVATPANPSTTCTGGTVTAADGTGVITYTGGTVAAGATCTVVVDTTGVAVGSHVNVSGNLTSSSGDSGTATDTLVVDAVPPGFTKAFAPDVISVGGVSTLTFTIDNPTNDVAVGGLAFTDNLPAGVVIATPANTTSTCGGTLTAPAGGGTISLAGGSVAAMSSCTISVDTTSAVAGDFLNAVTLDSDAGPAGPATATLFVIEAIGFTKMFLGDPVLRGGLVDLEYTITNPSSTFDLVGITFSDDLDAAVPGLAAVGLPTADVCGAGSSVSGTGTVTLSGGNLAANASCTFAVSVQVPADAMIGTFVSTSEPVLADAVAAPPGVGGGARGNVSGPPATASITIVFLTIEKSFPSEAVVAGTSIPLTFTITNPDPINGATDINFTDDLDSVIPGFEATDLPMADVCGAGSAVSGTSVISLTGGVLDPGGSCTFMVSVLVPNDAVGGTFTNITSVLGASVAGNPVVGDDGTGAVADIQVLSNTLAIPTLGTWGLIAMILGLMIVALSRMRS